MDGTEHQKHGIYYNTFSMGVWSENYILANISKVKILKEKVEKNTDFVCGTDYGKESAHSISGLFTQRKITKQFEELFTSEDLELLEATKLWKETPQYLELCNKIHEDDMLIYNSLGITPEILHSGSGWSGAAKALECYRNLEAKRIYDSSLMLEKNFREAFYRKYISNYSKLFNAFPLLQEDFHT
jgi:hypothetical protein